MPICRKDGCDAETGRPTYVLCEEHRKMVRERTKKRLRLKDANVPTTCSSTTEFNISQTFSKHQRREVTQTLTSRTILKNADGTTTTKEFVRTTTKAEEVISSMTNAVKEIHSSSVQCYQQAIKNKYKCGLSNYDRVKQVVSKLNVTRSPFRQEETLFESLRRMTLPEMVEQEETFLRQAFKSLPQFTRIEKVLPHISQYSALHEMITNVQNDYDVYMPYKEYFNFSTSDAVEKKVQDEVRLDQQKRICEYFDDPDVREKELKRQRLFVDKFILWGGERRLPTWKDMYTDMNKQEFLRNKISTDHVRNLLEKPKNWILKTDFSTSKEARMTISLQLYDDMNDAIHTNNVFSQGGAWDDWKSKICEHYLLLKLLIGNVPAEVKINPKGIRKNVPFRHLLDGSFFDLDYAFFNGRRTEDIGELSIIMENSCEILNVCIEMTLLDQKIQPICEALTTSEILRFKNDPVWALVTPDNLIKRHLSSADSNITESIDKLLNGNYPGDGLTQKRLLDMVETAYMNYGQDGNPYNDVYYQRLANMLPATYKQRLDNNKSQRLPPDLSQLMDARQKKITF